MKKAIKIAAMFVLLISIFTLSASAKNKTIEWDYYSDGSFSYTYTYGGELKIGANEIMPVEESKWFNFDGFYDYYVYYEFEVETSGYYKIETLNPLVPFSPDVSQDIRDGVVYGEKELIYLDDYSNCVFLDEGDSVIGVNFFYYEDVDYGEDFSKELNISYLGKEITDVQIDDEYLEDIILGYHISTEYDDENKTDLYVSGKMIFDNGTECVFWQSAEVTYPEDIAPGKNKLTFDVVGFKKDYTVDIKTIDDYIEKIEIRNLEEVAVVTETFLPDYIYSPDYYIDLVITLPDGTEITDSEVYYYYDLELKGEKELTIWFEYDMGEDGKWYLIAYAGNEELLREPCETAESDAITNGYILGEKIAETTIFMLEDFSWYMSDAFGILSGLSITERFESFIEAFNSVKEYYEEIFSLIKLFREYIN